MTKTMMKVKVEQVPGFSKEYQVTMGGECVGRYPITKAKISALAVSRALLILNHDVTCTFPNEKGETVTLINGVAQ